MSAHFHLYKGIFKFCTSIIVYNILLCNPNKYTVSVYTTSPLFLAGECVPSSNTLFGNVVRRELAQHYRKSIGAGQL